MRNVLYYTEYGQTLSFADSTLTELKDRFSTSEVETEDGTIFTVNRRAYPERTGKIRNLVKINRSGEVLWSLEPNLPQLPPQAYDYFTSVLVHDDARGLVEARTASGYKLIVDAATGQVQKAEKEAGLPLPEERPAFPGSVDNLWKVSRDGTVLQTLAPPRYRYPYIDYFWSISPGDTATTIRAIYRTGSKPNLLATVDVRDLKILSSEETF